MTHVGQNTCGATILTTCFFYFTKKKNPKQKNRFCFAAEDSDGDAEIARLSKVCLYRRTVTFHAVLRGVFVYSGGKKKVLFREFSEEKHRQTTSRTRGNSPDKYIHIYTHTALMYKRICSFVLVLSPSLIGIMRVIDLAGLHTCVVWFD